MTRTNRRAPRPSSRNWTEIDPTPPSSSAGEPEFMMVTLDAVDRHADPAETRTPADHERRLLDLEQRFESFRRRLERRVGTLAQQVRSLRRDVDRLDGETAQGARRPG
ncbi:hypothetical protein WMF37_29215 [Sorangium sp. So ce291]|uniref:hypothetical protein n=1 Tax=Sorangium sp. So ce291 TaxID=3133294 RepID=UPI003F6053B7